MEELAKGIRTIFDKIADFFDIFDLSFFVSGIGTGSAFMYLYYLNNNNEFELPISSGFLQVILIIIFFYIMGLVSFALGRFIRLELFRDSSYKKMDERLRRAIKVHSLEEIQPYKKYLQLEENDRGAWRLYVRLWAKLRDEPKLVNSFSQVKRYWVMSATYDGIVISLFSWALTVAYLTYLNRGFITISYLWGSVAIIFLIVSALGCKREAERNLLNQADEIVAIAANNFSHL